MNEEIKKEILNEIKKHGRIIITRHTKPDGDAVGSSLGLKALINASYPEKEVYCVNKDHSDYVAFLGSDEGNIDDSLLPDALQIILDTGTAARISSDKYGKCEKVIVIDHHIEKEAPYGDLRWVEDDRSSTCEMIADFYLSQRDELTLDRAAALCIYTGMVTDTGRFKYGISTGETLRIAAELIDTGIDLENLYANLYLDSEKTLRLKSYIYGHMKFTENGVAYIYVSLALQKKFGLNHEEASDSITLLSGIKDSIIWLAFIENEDDDKIRVRLRSRFVTVDGLAAKYGGGGHARASGAVIKNRKEMKALLTDADALIKNYKDNNKGWI